MDEGKTWIDEAIEREATPKALREETTRDFCAKRGIPESTYYYEVNKKEVEAKIQEICFRYAKKYTPDVLENLGERATKDNKAAELFLDYVLEKKKKFDLTSDDKAIEPITAINYIVPNGLNNPETDPEATQGVGIPQ